jgi:ABC-type transport system involved in cytochrome c biogenesis permease subunit
MLGAITAPTALLTCLFATFSLPEEMQKSSALVPALQSNWLMMHVTVMILSYAALISGSLLSIAFLVLTYNIDFSYNNQIFQFFPTGSASVLQSKTQVCECQAFPKKMQVCRVENPADQALEKCSSPKGLQTQRVCRRAFPLEKLGSALADVDTTTSRKEVVRFEDPEALQTSSKDNAINNIQTSSVFPASSIARSKGAWHLQLQLLGNGSLQNKFNFAVLLDNLSYRILGIGFPLLTIGILSGAVWANEAWGSYWSWDPKETWALLTWLVFAIYLHTRLTKGWQGRKPAIIASLGFFTVWICFLGVNLLGEGLHSYGFFA